MKFIVEFKQGPATVVTVQGMREIAETEITAAVYNDILTVERTLEQLTGLRVHVQQRGETEVAFRITDT